MPRLVCVVEGQGEVEAVPILCARILTRLEAYTWFVDKHPVRQPRSRLVDQIVPSRRRTAFVDGLERAVALAVNRPADGVLVMCDSDDDCPAVWGPFATQAIRQIANGAAVMAVREYEAWLITSIVRSGAVGHRPIESVRGAKEQLKRVIGDYRPTQDQARLTRELNIDTVWSLSDSFDKLVRTIAAIVGAAVPQRPTLAG